MAAGKTTGLTTDGTSAQTAELAETALRSGWSSQPRWTEQQALLAGAAGAAGSSQATGAVPMVETAPVYGGASAAPAAAAGAG